MVLDMAILPWKRVSSSIQVKTSIFSLETVHSRLEQTRQEHDFHIMRAPDWVNIIAVTEDEKIILIRQFRHGCACVTTEIPGGTVDPGEAPLTAAKRELSEETGYEGGQWEQLGVVEPNPAFLTNNTYTFLATGVRHVRAQHTDEHEQIDVFERSWPEVLAMLGDGTIRHALVVAAFAHWKLH